MRIAQIVYKVNNLEEAVKEAKEKGFYVEYGSAKEPYNAFIYFSNGPFIELMENTGVPGFIKVMMKLLGFKKLAHRFEVWDQEKEGSLSIGIEVEDFQIREMKKYLEARKKVKVFQIPSKRVDIYGNSQICHCLFPEYTQMPFFVTKYNQSVKKEKTNHENGIAEVEHVYLSLKDKEYDLLEDLLTAFELKENLGATITRGNYGFTIQTKKKEGKEYVN